MSDLQRDADDVVVPGWALHFVLYRYRHGIPYRDGATATAESILQHCLDTQWSEHSDGPDLGAEYGRRMSEPIFLTPEDEDKVADLLQRNDGRGA